MNEKIYATLKSAETEDWLDYHVVRPFSYYWAVFFNFFNIHPNTVTVLSMIVGVASAAFFVHGSYFYEGATGLIFNIIAIVMLCIADILDCTDGQLARMTGKKSRLGRILDGVAGFVWFVPVYLVLIYRFYLHHSIEFGWLGIEDTPRNALIATCCVFAFALYSGLVAFASQQRLADYYIQVHLFFLKGEKGSELDNSARQQEIYDQTPWKDNFLWKVFLKNYVGYTQKQESATPEFQNLLNKLREKYGSLDNIPQELREEIHSHSLPLMKWNGLLTFNFRSAWLFLFCLLDVPVLNFLFEGIAMQALCWYVNHRHETFCRRIAEKL
ncbi:MAG: CDP-alcohol phosphatidyltransferase family protein [Bacteroidaceae bacterium]|nr:CDP-alcohol phosphatidyltransferase family protein [Bacteroidaceae bacterium]